MYENSGSSFRASDGVEIQYYMDDYTDPWREAETVVLVTPVVATAKRLFGWVPHLARDFRVVRFDMRGHGKSGKLSGQPLTMDRLADDITELLDAIGAKRAHLAGTSTGGIIGLYTAATRKDRVSSLGAYAAVPKIKASDRPVDPEDWIRNMKAMGLRAFFERSFPARFDDSVAPKLKEFVLDDVARNDIEVFATFLRLMGTADFVDRIREIACPTLLVYPSADPNLSYEEADMLHKMIKGSERLDYEGLRHNIADAYPDRCATDLLAFLKRIDARS